MSTHKISFPGEIKKLLRQLPPLIWSYVDTTVYKIPIITSIYIAYKRVVIPITTPDYIMT